MDKSKSGFRIYHRKCVWCGTEFRAFGANKKFCSKSCYRQSANERRREKSLAAQPTFICPVCGKGFKKKIGGRKYCSRECYRLAVHIRYRAQNPAVTAVCPICGKEFIKKNAAQKYCSRECYKENAQRLKHEFHLRTYIPTPKKPPEKAKRICAECGKEYISTARHQKYCSTKCRTRFHDKKKAEKNRENLRERQCEYCGSKFSPCRKNHRYCSNKCANLANYYNKHEKMKLLNRLRYKPKGEVALKRREKDLEALKIEKLLDKIFEGAP